MSLNVNLPPREHFLPGDEIEIHLPRAASKDEIRKLRKHIETQLPGIEIIISGPDDQPKETLTA